MTASAIGGGSAAERVVVFADRFPRGHFDPAGWRVAQILSECAARPEALDLTLVAAERLDSTIEGWWNQHGVEVVSATTDLDDWLASRAEQFGLAVVCGAGGAPRVVNSLRRHQNHARVVLDAGALATLARPPVRDDQYVPEERPGLGDMRSAQLDHDHELLARAHEVWFRSQRERAMVASSDTVNRVLAPPWSPGDEPRCTQPRDLVIPVALHHEHGDPDLDALERLSPSLADLRRELPQYKILVLTDRALPRPPPGLECRSTRSDRGDEQYSFENAAALITLREDGPTPWAALIAAGRARCPVVTTAHAVAACDPGKGPTLITATPATFTESVLAATSADAVAHSPSPGAVHECLSDLGLDPTTGPDPTFLFDQWYQSAPASAGRDHQLDRWLRRSAYQQPERSAADPGPLLSIVMPVYAPPVEVLEAAINSVLAQTYGHWELCIAEDCAGVPEVLEVLRAAASADHRIRLTERSENGGIAAASTSALELATGEFVALLDHDDMLTPDALRHVVDLIHACPDVDMIYSDEDKVDESGRRRDPYRKPGWSPDLHLSYNYTCHFAVYRKSLLHDVGGFRSGFDGSQDFDLSLRVSEKTGRIAHIPRVLYHWRAIEGSAARDVDAKSYAWDAGRRALDEALRRRRLDASVGPGIDPHTYRVRYAVRGRPRVCVIIPTRDRVELLRSAVESVQRASSKLDVEILVVDNDSADPDTLSWLDAHDGSVVRYPHQFSFARMMNLAAETTDADLMLFLNNDVVGYEPTWLEALVEHAQRPEVGAVGARLTFPDERVQHEGIVVGVGGVAGNVVASSYFSLGYQIRNYWAVTGACLMTRPDAFWSVGGFEDRLRVAFNDVDLCMRIHEAGYNVVYTPYASLMHHESASRGSLHPSDDEAFFVSRWGRGSALVDPSYNPALSRRHPYIVVDDRAYVST